MRRALALILLLATPATAEMRLPTDVLRVDGGWVRLVYPPVVLEAGQAVLVQLCLRAAHGIQAVPILNALPASGRADKVDVLVTPAGFFPVAVGDDPPYVTYRLQNVSEAAEVYELKLWVREREGDG